MARAKAYTFDAESLAAEADAPVGRDEAIELFAVEVADATGPQVRGRVMAFDPTMILLIVQAITSIVAACKQKQLRRRLEAYRNRPNSLASRMLRRDVARRLPDRWGDDRYDVAARMLERGSASLDDELWAAAFPPGEAGDEDEDEEESNS